MGRKAHGSYRDSRDAELSNNDTRPRHIQCRRGKDQAVTLSDRKKEIIGRRERGQRGLGAWAGMYLVAFFAAVHLLAVPAFGEQPPEDSRLFQAGFAS